MKKVISFVLLIFMLSVPCLAQTSRVNNKVANVRAAIVRIYSYAFSHLNNTNLINHKYLTDDFRLVIEAVKDHDRTYHRGEVGRLDFDIWTMSQDPSPKCKVAVSQKVTFQKDYNDDTIAYTDIIITYPNGKKKKVGLSLRGEGRTWYIDDMSTSYYKSGLKADLRLYMATD